MITSKFKTVALLAAGALAGAAAGFALGIFFYPYIFLSDVVASETAAAAGELRAHGRFIHANPADPIHYGKGRVVVRERGVFLDADFEVGPGPKFHVYLVKEKTITPALNVEKLAHIDLGRLKAFKGSQNYPVPDGTSVSDYGSVVIWCEQFNVLISPATLTHAAGTKPAPA